VTAAREMLTSTLKWRKEFKVDKIITGETFDDTVFGKVGIISGKDCEGRPVRSTRATTRAVTYDFFGRSLTTFTVPWTKKWSLRT
jgi:hypothetical protein